MGNTALLITGSAVITLWGISHIVPTRGVVDGFGALTLDNRRIITMEWVAEGLTLAFIGALGLLIAFAGNPASATAVLVYRALAVMLIVMAAWTLMTGARTSIIPIKICPAVKTICAVLLWLGTL
jgi:hypothetical protein